MRASEGEVWVLRAPGRGDVGGGELEVLAAANDVAVDVEPCVLAVRGDVSCGMDGEVDGDRVGDAAGDVEAADLEGGAGPPAGVHDEPGEAEPPAGADVVRLGEPGMGLRRLELEEPDGIRPPARDGVQAARVDASRGEFLRSGEGSEGRAREPEREDDGRE